jgi:hypothetical protein
MPPSPNAIPGSLIIFVIVARIRVAEYVLSMFRRAKPAVPEGRLKNRPALQRRLLKIQIGPVPKGRGSVFVFKYRR